MVPVGYMVLGAVLLPHDSQPTCTPWPVSRNDAGVPTHQFSAASLLGVKVDAPEIEDGPLGATIKRKEHRGK